MNKINSSLATTEEQEYRASAKKIISDLFDFKNEKKRSSILNCKKSYIKPVIHMSDIKRNLSKCSHN